MKRYSLRRGFTLVELMVVIIIVAIVAGLGDVTYSATMNSISSNASKTAIDIVAQAEQRFYADYGSYTAYPSDLSGLVDHNFTLTNGTSANPSTVSLALGADGTLALATQALAGSCESAQLSPEVVGGAVSSSGGTVTTAVIAASSACTGTNALPSGDTAVTPASEKY